MFTPLAKLSVESEDQMIFLFSEQGWVCPWSLELLHLTISRSILPIIMAAHETGLKTQERQRNLYAIYTRRNQNSIYNIA